MTLKIGMLHRMLEYYQVYSNEHPKLTFTYFTARSNLVPYAFVWESVDIKTLSPGGCMPPAPGLYICIKS